MYIHFLACTIALPNINTPVSYDRAASLFDREKKLYDMHLIDFDTSHSGMKWKHDF